MSSVGGHGLFSLCSLPSINEDDELAFLRSGSGSGARPSSPNLLVGLPEGIKRERTPFHREERATTPVAAAPTSPPGLKPSPMSPSKKRKLGSGSSSSSNGVRSPGAPANRKSPTPTPRQPAPTAAAAPVRAPIPLISVPGLPSAIANIIASNLNPALLRQLQQRRSQQQLQAQPQSQAQPQRQLRPLPVLQRTKSTNKENKENSNGLHFTVTRFAAASRDARRPQRRSKRGGPGEVTTLTAKNMNIKDYLEALESVEKLNQWKRARRTEEDILEEELKEEMEEEEEGKERDPREDYGLPDFFYEAGLDEIEPHLVSDSESDEFSDFSDDENMFPVGEYGAWSYMFPELNTKLSPAESRVRIYRGERFQLRIRPHKDNLTLWDRPDGIYYWAGYMVITDALSYPNRRDVPNICSLRIQFRSYTPSSVPVLTPKPTNTDLNHVIDGNESTSNTAFNLEFPECLSLDSPHKMIINRWHASEYGWVACFLVPLPASLFTSCETRAFKLDAQMHIMEALQMQGLRAETLKVTVSHLKKAKEMGIAQDTEMQAA